MSRRKLGSSLETNKLSPEEEALVAAARPKTEHDSGVESRSVSEPSTSLAEEVPPELENSESLSGSDVVAPNEEPESQQNPDEAPSEVPAKVEESVRDRSGYTKENDESSAVDIEFLENTQEIEEKPKKRKRKPARKPQMEEKVTAEEPTANASNAEVVLITDSFKLKREIRDRLLRASFERKLSRSEPYTKQAIVNDALESWLSEKGF